MTLAGMAGGSVVFSDGAEGSADMQVDAPSLEVTTPNGTVEEIIVYLTADATYGGFDEEVTELGFTTTLDDETVHSGDFDVNHPDWMGETGPESGDFTYRAFMERFGEEDRIFLFDDTGFEPADFEVPDAGASETFDLDFEVEFRILSEGEVLMTREDAATASITIHNEADDDGGGDGTEDDDGDEEGSEPEASMSVTNIDITVELPNGETVGS